MAIVAQGLPNGGTAVATVLRDHLGGRSMAEWLPSDCHQLHRGGTEEEPRRLNGCPNIAQGLPKLHRGSTGEAGRWLSGCTGHS